MAGVDEAVYHHSTVPMLQQQHERVRANVPTPTRHQNPGLLWWRGRSLFIGHG
jgi:hypothetical protein